MFSDHILGEKTILITGGSSGLGFAMADRFAECGANVAICGRNEEKLQNAAEKLQKHNIRVVTYSVDIRDYDAVGEMFEDIVCQLGGLNGLVNNAAGNFLSASEDLTPNGFKSIVDIVLVGTFYCTHTMGNYLIKEGKPGVILNIVTTYARFGSAFVMPSACAKAGVVAMTRSLAAEWAEYKIRVNAIAPGAFPTKGAWSRLMPDPEAEKQYKARIPLKRFGEKKELADLAVFLMADISGYITGECITIDGGEQLIAGQFNFLTQLAPREKLKQLFRLIKGK